MLTTLALTTRVLRDPAALVDEHDSPTALARLAPSLLGITVAGGALFGLMVGSQRGGVQLLYASVKMPILLLVPPLVALPAMHALWRAAGVGVSWRRLSVAALAGMSRSAVLAAALGPVLWLLYSMDMDYHQAILLMVGTLAVTGLPGIASLVRALPRGGQLRGLAAVGSMVALVLAFAQTGWLLRPFIARPTAEVAFLRPVEEDVFSSLGATQRSAAGNYSGWKAEQRGLLARPEAGGPAVADPAGGGLPATTDLVEARAVDVVEAAQPAVDSAEAAEALPEAVPAELPLQAPRDGEAAAPATGGAEEGR